MSAAEIVQILLLHRTIWTKGAPKIQPTGQNSLAKQSDSLSFKVQGK